MNLVSAFTRKKSAGGVPYGGGLNFTSPFSDAWNKNRSPSPLELIRENLGTAYTCSTLNANLIASTPLRLYVKTRNGEGKSRLSIRGETRPVSAKAWERLRSTKQIADADNLEEVKTHPALTLLDRPNMMNEDGVGMSGFNLFDITQAFEEVVGRCYWWLDKSGIGGTPSSIWILAPQKTTEIAAFGDNDRIIDHYTFSSGRSSLYRYEIDEVVPFRMPDLYNVYTGGISPLRSVFEQVRLGRKVDAHTNATLDNGGKPSAIYSPSPSGEVGGFMDPATAERLRRALRQQFSRAGAGGVLVSETAGVLQVLNWPINDIIDPAMREISTDMICGAYQVPTTLVKRNDANLASARTGDYAHAKYAGLPRLRRMEANLNQFYLPAWGAEAAERLFFAYDDPAGLTDPDGERIDFNNAAARGSVTRNEERDRLGKKAVPWGDAPVIPKLMIAVDEKTGEPIQPVPPMNPQQDENTDNLAKSIKALDARLKRWEDSCTIAPGKPGTPTATRLIGTLAASPRTNGNGTHSHRTDLNRTAVQRAVIGTSAAQTESTVITLPDGAAIQAVLHRAFGEQRRAVMTQIEESHAHFHNGKSKGISLLAKAGEGDASGHQLPESFIPLDKWTTEMAQESKPAIEIIMQQSGRQLLTQVGASQNVFAVVEKNIPKAAEELTLKFCDSTNATTSQQLDDALQELRGEIADGLITGDPYPQLIARVQKVFDQADDSRADVIAKTEASRAKHSAEQMSAKESGVVSGKRWLASADACDICQELAEMGTIPLDQQFSEDDYGIIDAPPSHPRCQCSISYVTTDPDET